MLIYTPKVGRLIACDAFVDDLELSTFKGRLMDHVLKNNAGDVVRHIVEDCTVTSPNRAMKGTNVSIRAIVMSEEEFRKALDDAYRSGAMGGRP